jgi:hypothetical protein
VTMPLDVPLQDPLSLSARGAVSVRVEPSHATAQRGRLAVFLAVCVPLFRSMLPGSPGSEPSDSYRYPLETLAACGLGLYLGRCRVWEQGVIGRSALTSTTAYSIAVHAVAAVA